MRSAVILFCFCLPMSLYAQRDHQTEAYLLKNAINREHLKPRTIDDTFSEQVFKLFLETLDPEKLYFTEAELKPLRKYTHLIDDELNGTTWKFLNELKPVFRNALVRAQGTVEQLGKTPVPEKTNGRLVEDTVNWAGSEPELLYNWRMRYAFEVLDRITSFEKKTGETPSVFFNRCEPLARAIVRSIESRAIKRILEHNDGFDNHVASVYFQSISGAFDPHTTYLPATEMENFLMSLSTEGYYFGVTLDENERGDIVLAGLTPGGPAWRSGELHTSDVVVRLAWQGREPIEVAGMSREEVDEILESSNHLSIAFTVRNMSGIETTVQLKKEKISLEENYVRSYILEGRHRIGYISLPDFYTRWGEDSEGSRCASDVAQEIMKLRKENINGIIFDIRYNGGGSMYEALEMAGIFIDEGSLGIHQGKQELVSLKDMNRGTVYDGPMIVLVNGQSASASEFFSSTMQDYNRALIVGSRTFGKGSEQEFFPLQGTLDNLSLESLKDGMGVMKITTGRFYRVTGRSVQGRGVVPDVSLPDIFDVFDYHESSLPFSLPRDSVSKRTYYKPALALPSKILRERSEERVHNSDAFQQVTKAAVWVKELIKREHEDISLSWKEFEKDAEARKAEFKKMQQSLTQPHAAFEVSTNEADRKRYEADEYAASLNQSWIRRLKEDIYVEESFQIISDLIDLNQGTIKK
ncbi:MAG TPA: carboxy terminal-processing peptidase [Ohtaekwangia sp.]